MFILVKSNSNVSMALTILPDWDPRILKQHNVIQ